MSFYESECGTKQSSLYEVRHFYKKLYFNPGICEDSNEVGYQLSLSLLLNHSVYPYFLLKVGSKDSMHRGESTNRTGKRVIVQARVIVQLWYWKMLQI